jgi:hypothetical protein
LDDLENLAARRKHATAGSFVLIERLHEFDFVVGVFPLASGGVDLSAPLDFAPFDFDRYRGLALVSAGAFSGLV